MCEEEDTPYVLRTDVQEGGKDGAREKGCACRLCRRDELKYPSLMSKYGSVPRGEEQRYFWAGDGGLEVGLGVGK